MGKTEEMQLELIKKNTSAIITISLDMGVPLDVFNGMMDNMKTAYEKVYRMFYEDEDVPLRDKLEKVLEELDEKENTAGDC